jgi:hypothetical protein
MTDAVLGLAGAGTLIGGADDVFRVDAAATAVTALLGPDTGQVFEIQKLPEGGALIWWGGVDAPRLFGVSGDARYGADGRMIEAILESNLAHA